MATFVKGAPSISYKPVVFDLDFAYMERMLKMRQNMYNQGASKVKNLYNSLFTSTMLRDDNISKRDSYLKTISDTLKSINGLDFSMPQNVQNAMNVFEPITNDQYLVKDMSYTKNYQSELSKAQSYSTSTNPEEQKLYWDEGIKYMQYKADEFKNASKDKALTMTSPKYIPNVDVRDMADKIYKDGKISVKRDIVKDGYIWTVKNGDLAFPMTQTMVTGMFSENPAIKEAFKVQAYVQRKDWVKNNASSFGGDETKAEEAYMQQVIENTVNKNRRQLFASDAEVNALTNEVNSWEDAIEQGKVLKGSDDEKKYQIAVEKLKLASNSLLQKKIDMTIQDVNNLKDVDSMRTAVDGAVSMDFYNTLAYQTARYLADKNSEIGVKVDPYSMSDYRYDQNVNLKYIQAEINRQMEDIKNTNRIASEEERQQNRLETEAERQKNRLEVIDAREKNIRTRPKTKRTTSKKTEGNVEEPKNPAEPE